MHDEETPSNPSYEPYLHRTVRSPLTNFEAVLTFVKICNGIGMMFSAEAVSHAGYLPAMLSIPFIGIFLTYLQHVQFRSRYFLCRKFQVPYLPYDEGLKRCLEAGPKLLIFVKNFSSIIVDFISVANQFGSSSVYIMYISRSLEESFQIPARICIIFLIPIMMIFVFINEVKGLVPFNFVAMLLQLAALTIIFYYIFTDVPPITSRSTVRTPFCMPAFIAKVLGALEAVAVVNSIEENMSTPEAFLKPFGVLNLSMFIIVTIYYICGVGGYIKYGPVCCRNFFKCNPLTSLIPQKDTIALLAKLFYLVGVALSYGLCCYPAHSILWTKFFEKKFGNSKLLKYLFRMTIISGTFFVALIHPEASLLLSLMVNTFCLSFLAIIFPTVLHTCLLWPHNFHIMHIVVDLTLVLIGIFFMTVSFFEVVWISIQITNATVNLQTGDGLSGGLTLHLF